MSRNLFASIPFSVALQGTVNLAECCHKAGISRFVLVSSLGTDDGLLSPLGPVLFWKKRAEEHLQRSDLCYTIIRPGGLVDDAAQRSSGKNDLPFAHLLEGLFGAGQMRGDGNVVLGRVGSFGLPPKRSGSVRRSVVRSHLLTTPLLLSSDALIQSSRVWSVPHCKRGAGGATSRTCCFSLVGQPAADLIQLHRAAYSLTPGLLYEGAHMLLHVWAKMYTTFLEVRQRASILLSRL
jgi:hypothetical protein